MKGLEGPLCILSTEKNKKQKPAMCCQTHCWSYFVHVSILTSVEATLTIASQSIKTFFWHLQLYIIPCLTWWCYRQREFWVELTHMTVTCPKRGNRRHLLTKGLNYTCKYSPFKIWNRPVHVLSAAVAFWIKQLSFPAAQSLKRCLNFWKHPPWYDIWWGFLFILFTVECFSLGIAVCPHKILRCNLSRTVTIQSNEYKQQSLNYLCFADHLYSCECVCFSVSRWMSSLRA